MKYKLNKEELEKIVQDSLSVADVCRKLGIKAAGGNYKTINFRITDWQIDTSHFTGQAWNKGDAFKAFNTRFELNDILVSGSTYSNTTNIRTRLIKEGLKKAECEECGITKWNSKTLSFELDHINGNNRDHRIENLKILCPNCHSQTATYRGKNIKTPS